ncbi:MAG: hypothetical protein GC137_06250 [Alphaproteobacteria bacterium]|nr:hypothetical protein [Alphaproteobacteria bacterium]
MTDDKNKNLDNEILREKKPNTVQIFKPVHNILKSKLGIRRPSEEPGHIAEEKVAKAEALIQEMCANCHDTLSEQISILIRLWVEIQKMPENDARAEKTQEIFTIAHEIKDISSLCGYGLAAHFGESLRDYISKTSMNLNNQRIIIQAHVDALNTVHKNNLRDDGGPIAEELKKKVKIAIEKYS